MVNHYQVLGISESATPEIVKIAYDGKVKELARASLSDAERKAEEAALRAAYGTLSNPARRASHDAQLEGAVEREERAARGRMVAIGATLAVLLVGGLGWYMVDRSAKQDRIRREEARLAQEAEDGRRRAAAEAADKERREREEARLAQDAEKRERDYQQRVEVERFEHSREVNRGEAIADREASRTRDAEVRAERDRQRAERQAQEQAEREHSSAVREADRQKRYLEKQEADERRAREEKHDRATRDAEEIRRRDAAREKVEQEADARRRREEEYRRQQYPQTYNPPVKR